MRTRYISSTLDLECSTSLTAPHIARLPLLAAGLTNLLGAIGINGVVGQILAGIAVTAITMGVNYLMTPKPPKPEDGKAPKQQAVPFRIYGAGTCRIAGNYTCWEEHAGSLYTVQALCGHKISAITRRYLHEDEITVNEIDALVNELPDGRYGEGYIRHEVRLGETPETPYWVHASYLAADGLWGTDYRGDGTASLALICGPPTPENWPKIFPYQIPQASVVADMALVFDPRDPTQHVDFPVTWKFNKNSILILLWHICFNPYGRRRSYYKYILPVIDRWIEEADICDELEALAAGGFEPKYQCNGWSTTEHKPVAYQNAVLATCDGHLVERGDGVIIPTVGKFREDLVVDIYDEDIIGYFIQADVPEEDDVNRLVPMFTYPDTDYSTSDCDAFEDPASQAQVGTITRDADYGFVHSWTQARRLGYRDWVRARWKQRGSLELGLSGLNACYARWVRINSTTKIPRMNGVIVENRRSTMALTQGGLHMEWISSPPAMEDWTTALEGAKPIVPPKPNAAGITAPVINSLFAFGYSGSVYLRIVINDPGRADLTPVSRYRIKDIGGGVPGEWVTQEHVNFVVDAGTISLDTAPVPNDQDLQVEVAFKGTKGSYSNWSATEEVRSVSDTIPAGQVHSISVTPGAGHAFFDFTAPAVANYAGARIYWNTVPNFFTATAVSPPEYGIPGGTESRLVSGLPAGTVYGWITTLNFSGVEGTRVATGPFTVT